MPLAEVVLPEFDQETGSTCRALERVPEGKFSWKPHPQDDDARPLATLLAELPFWAVNALTKEEFDFAPRGALPVQPQTLESRGRILALFDQNAQAARRATPRPRMPTSRNPGRSRPAAEPCGPRASLPCTAVP